MNSKARPSQCRQHILSRFAEFFPLNLLLCRSLVFSHSDQSILHAPPPVTEPLAVHVSRGGSGGGRHFHNSAVCILSGHTDWIEQHYGNGSSDTNKTVMAVNLQRGMGLQGGAPTEMRFHLSYAMMSPLLYSTRRSVDGTEIWRVDVWISIQIKSWGIMCLATMIILVAEQWLISNNILKLKVNFSLCLTKLHAIKTYLLLN